MNFRSFYRIFFLKRRLFASPSSSPIGCLLFISLILATQSANAQALIEDIGQLRQKVAQFLTDEYQKSKPEKVDIKVGALDNRLRLVRCDQALALSLQDTTGSGGNINVQIACRGASSWTILVPAQASIYRQVAVAGRNIGRGEQVSAADLTFETRDLSLYRQGFVLIADDIVGKEVKYAVTKGDAFRTSVLNAPMMIKRGDEVSVEAITGSIRVVTNGTAASDGRLGQQIRVKNNQSERVVNARVVGPGKVQSIL